MNTALFIRRPVMTTLMMPAILIFGVIAYRLLPVNDLPNVDFPTIQVTAPLPGASPETMASAVATPLENQFSTIAGIDSMTSTSALGSPRSPSSSISTATSTPRRRMCSRPSPAAPPADRHADPAVLPKVNPADQPVFSCAQLADAAALHCERIRPDDHRPAHLDGQRRGPGQRLRGAEIRRARAARSEGAGRAGIGIDEVEQAIDGQRQPADRHARRRDQAFTVQASGQLQTPPPTGR